MKITKVDLNEHDIVNACREYIKTKYPSEGTGDMIIVSFDPDDMIIEMGYIDE